MKFYKAPLSSVILLTTILLTTAVDLATAQHAPNPTYLLEFEDPQSVHISPKGKQVLVRTRRAVVDSNSYITKIWLLPTDDRQTPRKLSLPKNARSIEWFPDGNHIAYLAPSDMGRQVWIKKVGADSARQVTQKKGGVRSFSFSPNGNHIAFTSLKSRGESNKKAERDKHGVEIDLNSFHYGKMFEDKLSPRIRPQSQLWIKSLESESSVLVSDNLTVGGYRWSPSGNRIALITKPLSILEPGVPTLRIDILVYSIADDQLQMIKKGRTGTGVYEGTVAYSKPFWSPSGDRLGFVRIDRSDRWASMPDVGIYNFETDDSRYIIRAEDQELEGASFHWLESDRILVEYTERARNGLFSISAKDGTISPIRVSNKHISEFSFSDNGQQVAWIKQSVGAPPEIYTARQPLDSPKKISHFYDKNDIWFPKAEYIEWTSNDGTKVQGWFFKPRIVKKNNPPPLLTIIHGGPGHDVNNIFHPSLEQWPYSVHLFAAKGYAVFIPNYRGTDSFGKEFQQPTARDGEPVQDVLSGIEYLISNKQIDNERLGIMGHSHGGWLGPQVIAEKPMFLAASFAEGVGSYLSLYGQTHGFGSVDILEHEIADGTPYENPERYLELSPAFLDAFTKQTPTLLEYGRESLAFQGMEMGRALWRHGTPHKFVIYPEEGHGLNNLSARVESMKRNLNWFQQWIPTDGSREK